MSLYYVAIPTYKRADRIGQMTLKTLRELQVPRERIRLFVANREELLEYTDKVDPTLYGHIVVGRKGLREQRNFIQTYYPEGTCLLDIDDDIYSLQVLAGNKLVPMEAQYFNNLIEKGFSWAEAAGTKLWGLYPVENHFFMKNTVAVGAYFVAGVFTGIINSHDKNLAIVTRTRTDYSRVCNYITQFGCVVRINFVTYHTKYYKEKGGCQEYRTKEIHDSSARYLIQHFPHLLRLQNRLGPLGNMEIMFTNTVCSKKF